jgi:hypothetical protein
MAFRLLLSTTGTDVYISTLYDTINEISGVTFSEPTVNFDLMEIYTVEEIREASTELDSSILGGDIVIKDGSGFTFSSVESFAVGDMYRGVFDSNNDNIVDASTNADNLNGFSGPYYLDLANSVGSVPPGSAPVDSVNGQTGSVVLDTDDISEGTNLYFTSSRARDSISAATGIGYSSSTGVFYLDASIDDLNDVDTTTSTASVGDYLHWDGSNWEPKEIQTDSERLELYNSVTTTGFNTSAATVILNETRINSSPSLFSVSSSEVTINEDINSFISFRVSTEISAGTNRSTSFAWIELDTGSGFVEVEGSKTFMYNITLHNSLNT